MNWTNQAPATAFSCEVGVRRIFWRAGNRVKTMIQVKKSPTATHLPISRTGWISEMARAAKPTIVAKIEAVQATNLFSSAKIWCSSTGRSAGLSTKREWR